MVSGTSLERRETPVLYTLLYGATVDSGTVAVPYNNETEEVAAADDTEYSADAVDASWYSYIVGETK